MLLPRFASMCCTFRSAVYVFFFSLRALTRASDTELRGVSLDDQSRYACTAEPCTFTCFSNPSRVLDHSAVNDNFCDCEDGSDEPGTSACAGQDKTLFYCPNNGSVPRMIYSSRVADGVCDCCDGSDELWWPNGAACANTCASEAAEREELLERLRKGLDQHKKARGVAKNLRQRWRTDIDALNSEIQDLQQSIQKTKDAQKAAKLRQIPSAVASRFDELMQLINGLKAELRSQQLQISELRSSQDLLLTENKHLRELIHSSSSKNTLQYSAGPSDMKEGTTSAQVGNLVDQAVNHVSENDQSMENAKPVHNIEKNDGIKQVSEYAKWMEKTDSETHSSDDVATEGKNTGPAADEQSKDTDFGAEKDDGAVPVDSEASDLNLTENLTTLQKNIDEKKTKIIELEGKLTFLSDDRLAYFSIMDTCIENKVDGYKYKICFFDKAHQDSVSLGKWSKWQGQNRGIFKGGQTCGGGLDRSLTVKFRCAEENQIIEVLEPGRCVYEATVHTPAACGKKSKEMLETGGITLRHPKDEL